MFAYLEFMSRYIYTVVCSISHSALPLQIFSFYKESRSEQRWYRKIGKTIPKVDPGFDLLTSLTRTRLAQSSAPGGDVVRIELETNVVPALQVDMRD